MFRKSILYILVFFVFLTYAQQVHATLYINEIYPAPTSPNSEWVEIYNDSNSAVDLTNYTMKDADNNSMSFGSRTIDAKGFIVLTSTSVLNNAGDTITLRNNTSEIIETITYPSISSTKAYVRCADGGTTWQTMASSSQNGPNTQCPAPTVTPTPTLTTTPTETTLFPTLTPTVTEMPPSTPTPTTLPNYSNIYISEVLTQPPSGQFEWVELYNDNDFAVTLQNWYLDDTENSGSLPKQFSITLEPKSYGVIELSSSMFNNAGDSVRLLDQSKIVKDSFEYSASQENITLGKISFDEDDICFQTPSKNSVNNQCINPTNIPTPTTTNASSATGSTKNPTRTPTPKKEIVGTAKQLSKSSTKNPTNKKTAHRTIKKTFPTIHNSQPSILGTTHSTISHNTQPMVKNFMFLSGSYSLLALSSLLFKLKHSFTLNK